MTKKLYVGNLDYEVAEEDLSNTFGELGNSVSANVVRDRYSGVSRGFALVEMATQEEAREAIQKLDNLELRGRKIVVREARPKREGGKPLLAGRVSVGERDYSPTIQQNPSANRSSCSAIEGP